MEVLKSQLLTNYHLEHESDLSRSIFENKGGDFILLRSIEKREFLATESKRDKVPEIAYGLLIRNLLYLYINSTSQKNCCGLLTHVLTSKEC
jgi:hypothetical protein